MTAKEKIRALVEVTIVYPESLQDLPVVLVRALADDTLDADADAVPDDCDECPGADDVLDDDADGVADGCDACASSADDVDTDRDGVADGCDVCLGSDDGVDTDGDGVPDGCCQSAKVRHFEIEHFGLVRMLIVSDSGTQNG